MRTARTRPAGGESGFTVVELMIAVVVLVVAVMASVSSQVTANNLLKVSRETNFAVSDAEAVLEALMLENIEDLPAGGVGYDDGDNVAAYDDLHLRNQRVVVTYPNYVAGAVVPDPLEVVVTVSWNDYAGRPRQVSLATLMTK